MADDRKHWKVYRGSVRHSDNGNVLFWATSKSEIKKMLTSACREDEGYEKSAKSYAAVYIAPTKRGVVEWLERNVRYDR